MLDQGVGTNSFRIQYAQRGVLKSLQNIKLRTFCPDPADLFLARNHNPLKQRLPIHPSHMLTAKFLNDFKKPFDWTSREPSVNSGLLTCSRTKLSVVYSMKRPLKAGWFGGMPLTFTDHHIPHNRLFNHGTKPVKMLSIQSGNWP